FSDRRNLAKNLHPYYPEKLGNIHASLRRFYRPQQLAEIHDFRFSQPWISLHCRDEAMYL
ncbi:MAG: hypothetical protein AAGH78_16505, partial [Cyanobacteria bacterium P01_H01_bin.58]